MTFDTIVSLPPSAAALGTDSMPGVLFAASDPPGRQIGSGGGTAWLLYLAWKETGGGLSFVEWLRSKPKLIVHASGQSRRLSAYAAEGKSRMPVPVLPSLSGQKSGQTLLDLQKDAFAHLLRHAPQSCVLAVACGDTLITCDGPVPRYPEADVTILGIPSTPEEAAGHGVMFSSSANGDDLDFFLQKPAPSKTRALASSHAFALDSGVWLFSEKAVMVLMAKCGWNESLQDFDGGHALQFDLYDRFGTALGLNPSAPDAAISSLTSAVLPLAQGKFFHFGTNRSVIASIAQLASAAVHRSAFGHDSSGASTSDSFIFNSSVDTATDTARPLWIENSRIPDGWELSGEHVLTGIPANDWRIALPRGICVDSVPLPQSPTGVEALRVYGFDDLFRGRVGDPATLYLGKPFAEWLAARNLTLDDIGICPDVDIQDAPIFPVLDWSDKANETVLAWICGADVGNAEGKARYLASRRVSATQLVQCSDLTPRAERRAKFVGESISSLSLDGWAEAVSSFDLAAEVQVINSSRVSPPPALPADSGLAGVHDAMFRERLGLPLPTGQADAFTRLREMLVGETALTPVFPERDILDDQIIWARSPARLDLAGGWSDTPPYCLEHGGRVANVAVDLNGQPPIQTFIRICEEPALVLRTIDLGVGEQIRSYEDLAKPSTLGAFSIPRAALRLAGFDPRFASGKRFASLSSQLSAQFGGGLEVSMLAAIPKGSGLGTSSILAATVLGALSAACSLGWSLQDIFDRTVALEQLLSSGGGWQDQVGGATPGAKLAFTRPGLRQQPDVRFLPEGMLSSLFASGRAILYYTGITRVARSILAEIVKGIFLGDSHVIGCIADAAANADFVADAIQRADESALFEAIRRSWDLNRELDAGTCPDSVAPIASVFARHGAAFKLLGAGGGGYMFGLAPEPASAANIRAELVRNPPNKRARFVTPTLSKGLQITRS